MRKLVFATNNVHKINEIADLVKDHIEILSLNDIGCNEEIPEEEETIQANAQAKAFYVYNNYGYNCFSDDTGLEIRALNGAPGVYSARYAGEERNSQANMDKVLGLLQNATDRSAQFRTVISLIIDGKEVQFEGIVKGEILKEKKGKDGFGYDPIFKPTLGRVSFAEMQLEEKNSISHRAIATKKLINYLKEFNT